MYINKEIEINNNIYLIKTVPQNDENLLMDDGEYHSGVTDFYNKIIFINQDLHSYALRYTLLHEITHAMIDSYGFMQVDWNNEIVADFIANNIYTAYDIMDKIFIEGITND